MMKAAAVPWPDTTRSSMPSATVQSQRASPAGRSARGRRQARTAAKIVRGSRPTDFALQQTRSLVTGMLVEYARAVQLQGKHREAGPHMYRAYGLANFAHAVLVRARRPLDHLGCDVRPLL